MLKKIKNLTIKRSIWNGYRRHTYTYSSLKNRGKESYCCLGILCRAMGMSKKEIEGHGFPDYTPRGKEFLSIYPTMDVHSITVINDRYTNRIMHDDYVVILSDNDESQAKKEEDLIKQFELYGINVKFVD